MSAGKPQIVGFLGTIRANANPGKQSGARGRFKRIAAGSKGRYHTTKEVLGQVAQAGGNAGLFSMRQLSY
jgi:hypothetical protein